MSLGHRDLSNREVQSVADIDKEISQLIKASGYGENSGHPSEPGKSVDACIKDLEDERSRLQEWRESAKENIVRDIRIGSEAARQQTHVIEEYEAEVQRLREELKSYQVANPQSDFVHRKIYEDLQKSKEEIEEHYTNAKQTIAENAADLQQAKWEVSRLQNRLSTEQATAAAKIDSLSQELRTKSAELQDLRRSLSGQEERFIEFRRRYIILEHHLMELDEQRTSFLECLQERQKQLDYYVAEFRQMQEALDASKTETDRYKEQITDTEKNLAEATLRGKTLETELKTAAGDLAAARKEAALIEVKLDTALKTNERREQELKNVSEEREVMEKLLTQTGFATISDLANAITERQLFQNEEKIAKLERMVTLKENELQAVQSELIKNSVSLQELQRENKRVVMKKAAAMSAVMSKRHGYGWSSDESNDDAIAALKKGLTLNYLQYVRGLFLSAKAHHRTVKRFIRLNPEAEEVGPAVEDAALEIFSDAVSAQSGEKPKTTIPLKEIIRADYGNYSTASVWEKEGVPWRCFTLTLREKNWDFYTETDKDAETLVVAVGTLLRRRPPTGQGEIPAISSRREAVFRRAQMKLQQYCRQRGIRMELVLKEAIRRYLAITPGLINELSELRNNRVLATTQGLARKTAAVAVMSETSTSGDKGEVAKTAVQGTSFSPASKYVKMREVDFNSPLNLPRNAADSKQLPDAANALHRPSSSEQAARAAKALHRFNSMGDDVVELVTRKGTRDFKPFGKKFAARGSVDMPPLDTGPTTRQSFEVSKNAAESRIQKGPSRTSDENIPPLKEFYKNSSILRAKDFATGEVSAAAESKAASALVTKLRTRFDSFPGKNSVREDVPTKPKLIIKKKVKMGPMKAVGPNSEKQRMERNEPETGPPRIQLTTASNRHLELSPETIVDPMVKEQGMIPAKALNKGNNIQLIKLKTAPVEPPPAKPDAEVPKKMASKIQLQMKLTKSPLIGGLQRKNIAVKHKSTSR